MMNVRKLLGGLACTLLMASTAQAAVISVTDSVFDSVDDSFDTKTLSFALGDFAGSSTLLGVSLVVDFSKCGVTVDASGCTGGSGTPFANEIGFGLRSPTGTTVSLVENDGENEAFEPAAVETFLTGDSNFSRIVITFDDAGPALGSLPATGTFAPVGSLSDFIGESGIGDWIFFYEDDVGADPLGIHSVTLNLQVADSSVPEPAPLALLGLGLALGLAARRGVRNARR